MLKIPIGNDFALRIPVIKRIILPSGQVEDQEFDPESVESLNIFLQHNEYVSSWHSLRLDWYADPGRDSTVITPVGSADLSLGVYNILFTGIYDGERFFTQQSRQFKIVPNIEQSDFTPTLTDGIETYTIDEVVVLDARGRDGLSAYEIAVANGYTGTESEWMETLKGESGNGILGIELISQMGNVDTYRITFTDGTHFDYTVTNSSGNLTPEQIAEIVSEVSQIITAGDLNAYTKDEVNALLNNKANASDLSPVATSGSYNDLSDKPTIPDELSDLSDDSTHRLVTDTEKSTWNAKQSSLTFDTTPTANSTNPVTSAGIKAYVDNATPTITMDDTPTSGSNNPVKSGGIYTALQGKQNTLTFDSTPTASSTNPVTSGGVKTALDAKANQSTTYTKTEVDALFDDVAYLGDDDGQATTLDFDPQSDTVWNIPQTLGSSQQAQARANIGVVDVSGTNDGTNWTSITIGSTTKAIPSGGGGGGGETNVIESISINGTTQTVTNKNVDLPVPTSADVYSIVKLTQAAYDVLATKVSTTLYIITAS